MENFIACLQLKIAFYNTALVFGKYNSTKEVLNLSWLPIYERREYNLLKLTYKGIYRDVLPDSLKLELLKVSAYDLRFSCEPFLVIPKEFSTFKDMVARSFNTLPVNIPNITVFKSFINTIRSFLFDKAKSRLER